MNFERMPDCNKRLRDRLGSHKFPLAMRHLTEMKTLLDQVRSELTSISRTKVSTSYLPLQHFLDWC